MRKLLEELTAPPAQILRTLQPTPYTVSYTVSTRAIPGTVLARLAQHVDTVLRILVGLATVLFLWVKWCTTYNKSLYPYSTVPVAVILRDWHLDTVISACQWLYLLPSTLMILYLVLRRNYTGRYPALSTFLTISNNTTEESLTVLRGLGIQTSTTSPSYLQTPTTRFIPTTSIQDIFIHETFRGFEVRFYLVVVVEGEEDVVVVFPKLLPRRKVLEEVWRGSRKCLWEEGDGKRNARNGGEKVKEGGDPSNVE